MNALQSLKLDDVQLMRVEWTVFFQAAATPNKTMGPSRVGQPAAV